MKTSQDMTKAASPAAGALNKINSWSTQSNAMSGEAVSISKGFCFGMGMGNSSVWGFLTEENLLLAQPGSLSCWPCGGRAICAWFEATLPLARPHVDTELGSPGTDLAIATGFGHILKLPTKAAPPAVPQGVPEVWSLCCKSCAPLVEFCCWAQSTLTDPSQEERTRAKDVTVMYKLLDKFHGFPFSWCQSINKRPALWNIPQQNKTEERLSCSGLPLYSAVVFAVSSPSNIGCSVSYKGIFSCFFLLAFIAVF